MLFTENDEKSEKQSKARAQDNAWLFKIFVFLKKYKK